MITDPGNWVAISSETRQLYLDCFGRTDGKSPMRGKSHVLSSSISPLRLYAFLRNQGGPPNGIQTFLRDDSVDNHIQWDFLVEDDTFVIEITGLNFRTELRLWAFVPMPTIDLPEIEDAIQDKLRNSRRAIDSQINKFERWHLVINTFQHLSRVIQRLERRLRTLDNDIAQVSWDDEIYRRLTSDQLDEVSDRLTEASTTATVIQNIAPVLGESAINFLITLLGRDEVRHDARMFQDSLRRNIDVRIKRLSIDCKGFKSAVDQGRAEFKEFMRLMGRRNELLHGNIDLRKKSVMIYSSTKGQYR